VVVAGSPEKALIAVRSSRPPALVISDLRMPSRMKNGVETIAMIGEILGRRIPGIILTGDYRS
jgi:CheY-like chemotaxis protein